jgi:diguanylate cyclase (GGDEF)-like protein
VAVRDAQGRATRIAGSMTDTERATAHDRLRSGFRDPLTGLCNRSVFVERLGQRLQDFKRHRRGRFATLYLDLDRFKLVNDSLGHLVGDDLLIAVSRRLEACLRPGDALARLGGDEFAILLDGLVEPTQANAIAFRIQDTLSAPFAIGGREVFTSASIGIAFCLTDYTNPEEIMRDADTAMYHAKSRGKARHELFDADMHARVRDRLGLENDLRHAVSANDFDVHYQPIVLLASGMCVGLESLIRWTRNGEPVSTAIFKQPITDRVMLRTLNLDGDRQADLTVHGGPTKAVYVYPAEHYEYWRSELPEMALAYGSFGENFTATGFSESALNIGDQFSVGGTIVMVTEPRMPCYKLGIRFGRNDIIKKFLQSERTGFYLSVLQEGEVGIGDEFQLLSRNDPSVSVLDVTRLYSSQRENTELLRRAIKVKELPEGWRAHFQEQLDKL